MNGKMTKKARAEVLLAWTEGFAPSLDSSTVHEIATTRVARERKAGMSFVMNGYIGMLTVKLAKSMIAEDGNQHPNPSGFSKETSSAEERADSLCPLTPRRWTLAGCCPAVRRTMRRGAPEEEERDLRPCLPKTSFTPLMKLADEA